MSGRRYDDREIARILQGAAEREALVRAGDASGGLTLPQLEQVAVEAGLDPALVRRAAAELDTPGGGSPGDRWRGGPRSLTVERVAQGAITGEATAERADALLTAVHAATDGAVGTVRTVGRTLAWHGRLDGAQADVTVVPADGRTTVRVQVALDGASQASFATYFLAAGGTGAALTFGTLLNVSAVGAALAAGAVASVGYLSARRHFARVVARHDARASALADAVATALAAPDRRPTGA